MLLDLLFLVLGFVPLIFGADWLVDGASALARRFKIPNIVIGLTIVAFGTSAPELVVNLFAATGGSTEIAFGNIVGSNIFNVLAILGVSALIYPLTVKTNTTWIEIPLALLAAGMVLVLANDTFLAQGLGEDRGNWIDRIDGLVLLALFVIFLVYNGQLMKSGANDELLEVKPYGPGKAVLFILLGLAGLVLGGRIIVEFAVKVAQGFGVPERLIGLTIVSIGTSLPELATSAVAARKKNVDIAIGNIVGSNLFNVFFILGLTAVITPVPLPGPGNFDNWVHLGASALLFLFIFTGRGRRLDRWEGAIFLALYVAYTVFLILAPQGA